MHKWIIFLWCIILSCIFHHKHAAVENVERFDTQFIKGVQAFTEENWEQCYDSLLATSDLYKVFLHKIKFCKNSCKEKGIFGGIEPSNHLDIEFFGRVTQLSGCLHRCKIESGVSHYNVLDMSIVDELNTLKHYDYLQECAFKLKKFEEAASYAYTYLAGNPGDDKMTANVQSYLQIPGVVVENVVNYEFKPHQKAFEKGVVAYGQEDWTSTVAFMEDMLDYFYDEYDSCEALCTLSSKPKATVEFYSNLAAEWSAILQCQHDCEEHLSLINGVQYEDLVAEIYNYLQFSYYKLGEISKAARACQTYLIFKPSDATMLHNKQFYKDTFNLDETAFQEHSIALKYFSRIAALKSLQFPSAPELHGIRLEAPPEKSARKQWFDKNENLKTLMTKNKFAISMTEDDLNGPERFIADGVLDSNQCSLLTELAYSAGVEGDGYQNSNRKGSSPHTDHEQFKGITITRAAELAIQSRISKDAFELYLNASSLARQIVQEYFWLPNLYFDYTHLVCRTAMNEDLVDRQDLSHPVHSDNCLIKPDGRCIRERPAYIERDYSALLYTNDDFTGGDFFFTHTNFTEQVRVQPRCGRLVGFNASNYHGVKAVLSGKRCAVALWFTLDPAYDEVAMRNALNIKHQLNTLTSRTEL